MTTTAKQDLMATLEDQGCRMTTARRRLVSVLEAKERAFGTEELVADVPEVGRATVYRTIKLLLQAGAICKTTRPDGSPRYTIDRANHHHHAVCAICGRISEFRHSAVERMLRSMRDAAPGVIVGHRLELYIECNACLGRADPN